MTFQDKRVGLLWLSLLVFAGAAGCGSGNASGGEGGASATGGGTGTGGTPGSGGTASGGNGSGTGGMVVATGGTTVASGGSSGSGGRAAGSGGRGSGGAATGGGTGGGAAGGGAATGDVCTRWKSDRADISEGTWNGAISGCVAGDLGAGPRANALRLVNLYRFLAGLSPVVNDPALDAKDQQCALMQRANNMLSHTPPTTWTCYTADGASAAGSSNISTGRAVESVDGYMVDTGNGTTIGHRRWILSNSLGPIGIGGTDKSSCMWTLNGTGKAGKAWTAWPSPGTIPLQAFSDRWNGSLDATGWTIQSDTINLGSAQVTVMMDGTAQPVTVTQLDANYGSKYAIRFNPTGWKTAAGKTYSVSVTGTSTPIAYDVTVVSCN